MSETTEVTSSKKKEQKKAKTKAKSADVTAEIDSAETPADESSESLLQMSSSFTSPRSAKSFSRSGNFQIDLMNQLDKDSVPVIELLNIVAMQQVLYKHGNKLQDLIHLC